jgi:hypothetical protein
MVSHSGFAARTFAGESAIPINARKAVPPPHRKCNTLPKSTPSGTICFKALRKREMQ